MNTAAVLALALLLDALFGEPEWIWSRIPHPAVLMGRMIGWCDARFNRGKVRRIKGCFCLLGLIVICALVGVVISLAGPVVEMIAAAILLAQKSLVQHVMAVSNGLRQSLAEGRHAVSMIVSRDTAAMDESAIARSAIESAAENLSDGVVAPAFWMLIAGLPGLIVYKLVNTADSMIGYRTPRHAEFGWSAARFDDVMNWVPSRLTALLLALPARQFDWRAIRDDARLHRSPNAGWPESALSRGLGIALAGPRRYDGVLRDFPWVNANGRRELSAVDIDASIAMLWKAWGILFASCAVSGLLLF